MMGPDVILTGSAGGTVSLHLVNTYPVAPFVTTAIPPSMNQLFVGGILTVGSPLSSPPGNYSGTFSITIIQE